MAIRITEIFCSIQGESNTVGHRTVFVRLTGCPMRCTYCDTAYAFHGGKKYELATVLDEVAIHQTEYVCITGGEPLAQSECITLMQTLCDAGYRVSLETGNAIDIAMVDPRVYIVLDIKTPQSGEEKNNRYANLNHIKQTDAVKFVICNELDYHWALTFVAERQLDQRCEVLFSPSAEQLPAATLADWILKDKAPARLQIQLHKHLWGNEAGR